MYRICLYTVNLKKLAELKQIKVTNCLKFLEVDEFQNWSLSVLQYFSYIWYVSFD